METIFASNKQRKCIIISNLGLFWLKLDKMCNLFNSCEESLHWGVWKFAKYVRNCVVFWKNLHSWQNFYTTAGRDGRDKFQVCARHRHSSCASSCKNWNSEVEISVTANWALTYLSFSDSKLAGADMLLFRYAAKQKKRYYLGIFPNMGGGSSQIPKLL